MKTLIPNSFCPLLFALTLFFSFSIQAQEQQDRPDAEVNSGEMKTYLIERQIPEIGMASHEDLVGISQKSCSVLDNMDSNKIEWIHSYVAEDKIYCIYKATDPALLKEHAEKGGFPINSITVVSNVISPATAKN